MKKILGCGLILAFCVIMMGAYTRLSDAGLSCPDWPNCYGYLTVTDAQAHQKTAELRFPERPLEVSKAWLEMIHRYIAGTLGCLIFGLALYSCIQQRKLLLLPTLLVGLVGLQVLLGVWTVTLHLMPLVVTGHLLGGFSLFSLLWIWFLSHQRLSLKQSSEETKNLLPYALVALCALLGQIFLGGWTASNYAATVCTELPFCQGQWWEHLEWMQALIGFLGSYDHYEFGVLGYDARMTIHVLHRIGAFVAFSCISLLVYRCLFRQNQPLLKKAAGATACLLVLQVSLGISHILFHFPVAVGVLHNAVASLLLLSCLFIFYVIWMNKKDISHAI